MEKIPGLTFAHNIRIRNYALFRVIFILLAVTPFKNTFSQFNTPPAYLDHTLIHYDDENGLQSNDIRGFVEDQNGFFWFATQFGIVRFDGQGFRVYNSYNTPVFGSNRFAGITIDSSGRVYMRDEHGEIFYLDKKNLISFSAQLKSRKNFLISEHGFLLDLTGNKNLSQIEKELDNKKYGELTHPIITTGKETAYFFSGSDVAFFDGMAFHTVINKRTDIRFSSGDTMITLNQGIFTQYYQGKKLAVQFQLDKLLRMAGDSLHGDSTDFKIFCNPTGSFLKNGNRVYTFIKTGTTLELKLILEHIDVTGLDDIYYARSARLYVLRTKENGFFLARKKTFETHLYRNNFSSNSFAASAELEPGKVLTTNGILFSHDSARRMLPAEYMVSTTIFKDRDNTIWYVHRDSLYQADGTMKTLKRYFLKDGYALSIQRDSAGVLWYASMSSLGSIIRDKMVFEYLFDRTVLRTECHFLLNDSIHWLGTTRGLVEYNMQRKTLHLMDAMKGKDVRNIQRASDGTIWLGTYGQGFYTYRNGKFIALPLDAKQYLASAHCFMEDKRGFFWISTNKGLFQVLKTALEDYVSNNSAAIYYYYYDKSCGFGTNEFNGGTNPAGIQLSDGTISLPSMNGLVWFHPEKINPVLPSSPLILDKIWAENKTYAAGEEIALPAAVKHIGFEIASSYFGHKLNEQIEYTLDSAKDGWKPILPDNTIVINYLPAGSYTLVVRKRAGFGNDHFIRLRQSFSVTPFFYETYLFKVLLVVLSIIVVAAVFERRERVTRERKRKLEALVNKRTEELKISVKKLSHTIVELEESENHLKKSHLLKDDLIAVVLHDIRSPLFNMGLMAQNLYEAIEKKDTNEYTLLAKDIIEALEQLNQFTKEFAGWLTIQQSGFLVEKDNFLLRELLDEINAFYSGTLNYRGNTLSITGVQTIRLYTDRQLLKTVVQNLVDNANKHTEKGNIEINAAEENETLTLKVTDNGNGIHPDVLDALRQGLSNDRSIVSEIGSQFGYKIIKDFVEKINGKIAIESVYNKGTTVIIRIPEHIQ